MTGMDSSRLPSLRCWMAGGERTTPARRHVRKGGWYAALGLGAGLFAGCAAPIPPLNVATWPFPGYEFLFLAREQGRLDERAIRLLELTAVTDVRALLLQGRAQAATLTLDEVLHLRSEGLDLRVLAVLDQSAGADALMARPGLREPAALRGRKLALEPGGLSALILDAFLSEAKLSRSDLDIVPLAMPQVVQRFQEGAVDAAITFEPYVSQLEEQGARRLLDSQRLPGLICDVLAARADVLTLHGPAFRQLLAGHFAALQAYQADPSPWGPMLALRLGVPVADVPQAFKGVDMLTLDRCRRAMGSSNNGEHDVAAIQAAMQRQGVMREGDFTEGVFVADFLEPA